MRETASEYEYDAIFENEYFAMYVLSSMKNVNHFGVVNAIT